MKSQTFILCLVAAFLFSVQTATGQSTYKNPEHIHAKEKASDLIIEISDSIIYDLPYTPSLCEEMGYKGQYIDIGNCKLYTETRGQGVPLLLINGGPGSTHHCFHPYFSKAEKFAKVIYYDQRGSGKSDFQKGDGYSVQQAINDIELLRKAMGIDQWVILGHSYGGFLAQYYTTLYPENVKGLILVCAATGLHNYKLSNSRQQEYISNLERKKFSEIRQSFQSNNNSSIENLRLIVYNNHKNGDWKRQSYYKPDSLSLLRLAMYEFNFDLENNFTRIMNYSRRTINLNGCFDNNPIPTMIIEGLHDLTWERSKAYILNENHPNARMLVFSKSGHSPFEDEPEHFFSELESFFNKLPDISLSCIEQYKKSLKKTKGLYFDEYLDTPINIEEKERIRYYKDIVGKINVGDKFYNRSTPLDCHLSFISACINTDTTMAFNLTLREWPHERLERYSKSLNNIHLLRVPEAKEKYNNGDLMPLYFAENKDSKRSITFMFIYWEGKWYRIGNIQGNYILWKDWEEYFRNSFFRTAASHYIKNNK